MRYLSFFKSVLFHLMRWCSTPAIFLKSTLIYYFWTNNSLLCSEYTITCCIYYHIFFIHSFVDGCLGWLHNLAVVNAVLISIDMHVLCVCVYVCDVYMYVFRWKPGIEVECLSINLDCSSWYWFLTVPGGCHFG